jgi:NADPH2:quinone reductase
MKAAFYDRLGPARDVLQLGEVPDPVPAAGEVRVRIAVVRRQPLRRQVALGLRVGTMPFPRVIPHSDGMGVIDAVGDGVPSSRLGQRVWTWNAAWGRPHGTRASWSACRKTRLCSCPMAWTARRRVPRHSGAHRTARRAHGRWRGGKTVFVAGGAGAVGHYAVQMASQLGARACVDLGQHAAEGRARACRRRRRRGDVQDRALVERVADMTAGAAWTASSSWTWASTQLPISKCCAQRRMRGLRQQPYAAATAFLPADRQEPALKFFIVYHLAAQTAPLPWRLSHGCWNGVPPAQHCGADAVDEIAAAHEMVERELAGNVLAVA